MFMKDKVFLETRNNILPSRDHTLGPNRMVLS